MPIMAIIGCCTLPPEIHNHAFIKQELSVLRPYDGMSRPQHRRAKRRLTPLLRGIGCFLPRTTASAQTRRVFCAVGAGRGVCNAPLPCLHVFLVFVSEIASFPHSFHSTPRGGRSEHFTSSQIAVHHGRLISY